MYIIGQLTPLNIVAPLQIGLLILKRCMLVKIFVDKCPNFRWEDHVCLNACFEELYSLDSLNFSSSVLGLVEQLDS